ncbi:MAG TPA: LPP20 family lipoprotein [Nitrospira sp.]|nr:LPP20 family lipoprotein [Nitrospira sp.]
MIRKRLRGYVRMAAVLGSALLVGCAFGQSKPAWIDGVSPDYPAGQYLTGVGQADNRAAAEDRAYAALARIFKAEVSAQSRDWESYLVVEQRGASQDERRLTLDQLTRVSTDKVLENASIVDRWYDTKRNLHYALGGMHRAQAETAFMERMNDLDRSIQSDVEEAHQTSDKLGKVRALRRAARNLVLRETYNADLRVIRTSGQGTAAAYRVQDLVRELEEYLSSHLVLAVSVTGDHVEPAQRALTEGLIREGLHVASMSSGTEAAAGSQSSPELLIRGMVRVWPIDVRDPQFTYVRWCSDFEVVDSAGQQIVGAISKGGKEGHLSEREATAKVIRVMQQDLSTDVAKAIAAHVYGESELPAEAIRPAGCPREGMKVKPATATH